MTDTRKWVTDERPMTSRWDRLWITIQYPNGRCGTIEGRYDMYEHTYLYPNQKLIKYKVVAWMKWQPPEPYGQEDQHG